jgi:hypothetical protein
VSVRVFSSLDTVGFEVSALLQLLRNAKPIKRPEKNKEIFVIVYVVVVEYLVILCMEDLMPIEILPRKLIHF